VPAEESHWTRDIQFTPDGKKMYVSVGSASNVDDGDLPSEKNRADVLEFNPDGSGMRIYAYGIRNCVGMAIQPKTNDLWCSVDERDALGDNLVPDYITRVQEGGFYGWPWWYMGEHQDPRHEGKHPELKDKVITPDVILNPHNASLEMTFYDGKQFPSGISGRHLRVRTRFMEPIRARRIRSDSSAAASDRSRDGRIRGFHDRIRCGQ
jgi:glucose/arabinose dehydrogenase